MRVTLEFETKNLSLGYLLSKWNSSAQPQRSKIWGSVSGDDRVARARCPRSSREASQQCVKIKEARKSNIFLAFGKWVPACINSWTWGTRICCRTPVRQCIWSAKKDLSDAEMDTLTKSCSPTTVRTANREVQTHEESTVYVCQGVEYVLDYESPRKHANSIVAWKAFRWKKIFLWMDQRSKTTSH